MGTCMLKMFMQLKAILKHLLTAAPIKNGQDQIAQCFSGITNMRIDDESLEKKVSFGADGMG